MIGINRIYAGLLVIAINSHLHCAKQAPTLQVKPLPVAVQKSFTAITQAVSALLKMDEELTKQFTTVSKAIPPVATELTKVRKEYTSKEKLGLIAQIDHDIDHDNEDYTVITTDYTPALKQFDQDIDTAFTTIRAYVQNVLEPYVACQNLLEHSQLLLQALTPYGLSPRPTQTKDKIGGKYVHVLPTITEEASSSAHSGKNLAQALGILNAIENNTKSIGHLFADATNEDLRKGKFADPQKIKNEYDLGNYYTELLKKIEANNKELQADYMSYQSKIKKPLPPVPTTIKLSEGSELSILSLLDHLDAMQELISTTIEHQSQLVQEIERLDKQLARDRSELFHTTKALSSISFDQPKAIAQDFVSIEQQYKELRKPKFHSVIDDPTILEKLKQSIDDLKKEFAAVADEKASLSFSQSQQETKSLTALRSIQIALELSLNSIATYINESAASETLQRMNRSAEEIVRYRDVLGIPQQEDPIEILRELACMTCQEKIVANYKKQVPTKNTKASQGVASIPLTRSEAFYKKAVEEAVQNIRKFVDNLLQQNALHATLTQQKRHLTEEIKKYTTTRPRRTTVHPPDKTAPSKT